MNRRPLLVCLLALLVAGALAPAQEKPVRIDGLDLGPLWYGKPVNDLAELRGQVVLFLMWGTCSSCNKVTPDLIKLARRLDGRPFRIIAAHSQHSTQGAVASYVRGLGLPPDTTNFTITNFGSHPKVETSGFVPYYLVFDHHGDLARHHTAGGDHGGDGHGMYKWVDRLMKAVPEIYLGRAPFEKRPELADAVAMRRKFPEPILEIEKRLAAAPEPALRAELERLMQALRAWRDREMARVTRDLAHEPDRVLPRLQRLARETAGTSARPGRRTAPSLPHGIRRARALPARARYAPQDPPQAREAPGLQELPRLRRAQAAARLHLVPGRPAEGVREGGEAAPQTGGDPPGLAGHRPGARLSGDAGKVGRIGREILSLRLPPRPRNTLRQSDRFRRHRANPTRRACR